MNKSPVSDDVTEKAIAWFVRLRAEDTTQSECKDFLLWLETHQSHHQEFIQILKCWEDSSIVREMDFAELKAFPLERLFDDAELSAAS